MVRKLFEEVQNYRQYRNFWYVVTIFTLVIFIPLAYVMYGQLVLGETFGRKLNYDVLMVILIVTILVWVVVILIGLSVELQTYVDGEGIHYRPASEKPEWITISKHDLVSFEVRQKRRTIFDSGGLSYYKKYKCSYMILRGSIHLELTLNDQRKIFLGTGRPEEFVRAIRKMMETTAPVYHG